MNYYETFGIKKRTLNLFLDWSYQVKINQKELTLEEKQDLTKRYSILKNRKSRKEYNKLNKELNKIRKTPKTIKSVESFKTTKKLISEIPYEITTPSSKPLIIIKYIIISLLIGLPFIIIDFLGLIISLFSGENGGFFFSGETLSNFWIGGFSFYLAMLSTIAGNVLFILESNYSYLFWLLALGLMFVQTLAINNMYKIKNKS